MKKITYFISLLLLFIFAINIEAQGYSRGLMYNPSSYKVSPYPFNFTALQYINITTNLAGTNIALDLGENIAAFTTLTNDTVLTITSGESTNASESLLTVVGNGTALLTITGDNIHYFPISPGIVPSGVHNLLFRSEGGTNYVFNSWRLAGGTGFLKESTNGFSIDSADYSALISAINTTLTEHDDRITDVEDAGTTRSRYVKVDMDNTASETVIFTNIVDANLLGTNKAIRVKIPGYLYNESGSGGTFTIRVYYGDTKMYDGTTTSFASSSLTRITDLMVILRNNGTTASQVCNIEARIHTQQQTSVTTGVGSLAVTLTTSALAYGQATEDSTAAKGFGITMQLSAANANFEHHTFGATETFEP